MIAAWGGHIECVRILLHSKADPCAALTKEIKSMKMPEGSTAADFAQSNSHMECFKLLIDKGDEKNESLKPDHNCKFDEKDRKTAVLLQM